MSFLGMNVSEGESLAVLFNNASETLSNLVTQLTNTLDNMQWVGPDRDRFVTQWQQTYSPQILNASNGLEAAAGEIARQVDAQLSASGENPNFGG